MCVICAAAKKRYMKRTEVVQAMKANSAGFFGFTIHEGERRVIRTLDDKQFLGFFDSVGDDEPWIMHARIPSRGEKSLDNVHGWEEDGILFCHNMTLTTIDGMMTNAKWTKTDSEFFFRHVFIPFYRGCGKDAYKDGAFCPDLDNLVRHFCGTSNKFLFIMPDNRLVTYGNWVEEADRKTEDGKVAFIASNRSYVPFTPSWTKKEDRKETTTAYSRYKGGYYDQFRDGYYDGSFDYDEDDDSPPAGQTGRDLADVALKGLGAAEMCRIALLDLVAHGTADYRAAVADVDAADDIGATVRELMPMAFSDETYDAVVRGLENLGDEAGAFTVEDFASEYALEFAGTFLRHGAKTAFNTTPYCYTGFHAEAALKVFRKEWTVFSRVAGVAVDFTVKSAATFACAVDEPVRDGNRWSVKKVRSEDILVDETVDADTTYRAIGKILDFIRGERGEAER